MDYRDAVTHKGSTEAQMAKAMGVNVKWWNEDDEDTRCKAMVSMGKTFHQNASLRHQANLRHARLYENVDLDQLSGIDYATSLARQAVLGTGVLSLNVVAAATDTLAAKIAKNKPRPNFLTSGQSWKSQRQARRLDKFMRGMFYETKVHEVSKQVFVDACTFGTGFLHVFVDPGTKRVAVERVLGDEVLIDDVDGQYGTPRVMYRRKMVAREVLIGMFPEKAEAIMRAGEPKEYGTPKTTENVHNVEVWEAWHLPSAKGAKDGKHIIAMDGVELECEPWKVCNFPFVVLRFKKRIRGFWGKGVAETLTGIQLELNRLIRSISEQIRRKGKGRIFLQHGSKVNPNHLTNAIADVVMYTGTPPIVDNNNAVAAEEFMQVDRLYARAFQEVGVSELSASAKKPSGLDAAVALREYSDIESERFALTHQDWEQFFLDFADLTLDLLDRQWSLRSYRVKMPSKRFLVEVDYKDVEASRESFIMQMFPVSSLPQTPAARYAKVKEMMQDGFIDKAVAQRLLEFPDLEAEANLGNAAIDDVDATISAILDEEEPKLLPLEPYQNAQLLLSRAIASYLFARHFPDIEEERLELLRQLIDSVQAALTTAMGAVPGAMEAPMGPPGAPPMGPGGPPQGPGGPTINVNAQPPVAPAVPPVVA